VKAKQLIRRLKKKGVEMDAKRGKGGHRRAEYQGQWATIAVHGDRDLSPEYIKLICKQLGLDPNEIL